MISFIAIDIIIICILLLLAVALVILELFFLPGLSVAGLAAVLFYGGALYYAFAHLGITAGIATLIGAMVITGFLIYYFLHSRMLDKMKLKTEIDSTAPTSITQGINAGDKGVALSRLNPMGTVLIGGCAVEAHSTGKYIEESTPVRVIKVEPTSIVVSPFIPQEENKSFNNQEKDS